MPVEDADMKTISQFTNLEKLVLNNSLITNNGINEIKKLKKLRLLSLAGTKVDKEVVPYFSPLDSLKEVFIWNTKISAGDAQQLQKQNGKIVFNVGYIPDEKEILTLNAPIVKNEQFVLDENEKIELKNQIPGVVIRYTLNGADPDSTTSLIYNEPISANGFTLIKARSVKPGWYSSPISSYTFFQKGIKPSKAELINEPNEKYKGEGATSLIDSKKGLAESFNDPAWLGFREKPFAALFYFDDSKTINSVSISYNKSVQSYLMPPQEIEIWAGEDKNKLKLIKKIFPTQVTEAEKNVVRIEGIKIDIGLSTYKCYKIVARNLSKLPPWHPGKGDKAWIFIDEIFFN
jgi:hypothetical protein